MNIFRTQEILRYFICYVIKKNLLTDAKLFDLRKLCKSWKNTIETESDDVQHILKYQLSMRDKLKYDKEIYDQHHYKRQIIKNILEPLLPKYHELKIPFIDSCYMDLDFIDPAESEKCYYVGEHSIPYEFMVFLREYYDSPTVYVKIYTPEIIKKVITDHKNKLREYLCLYTEKPELYGIIFLVPLCYSKHYREHYKDKQFLNILCYINLIDKNLADDFPDEKYIVLTVDIDDLEDNDAHYSIMQKYLASITKSITSDKVQDKIADYYYPQDLAQNAQSFDKCFENLIRNQKFNL